MQVKLMSSGWVEGGTMQVKLMSSEYSFELSLFVVPETDNERQLLRALWKHGRLEMCNGCADNSGQGFCVSAKLEKDQCDKP